MKLNLLPRWMSSRGSAPSPAPAPSSSPAPRTEAPEATPADAPDDTKPMCPYCGQPMPPSAPSDDKDEPGTDPEQTEQQAEGAGASPGSDADSTETSQETSTMATATDKPSTGGATAPPANGAAPSANTPATYGQLKAIVPDDVPGRDAFIVAQMEAGATTDAAQAALTKHLIKAANTARQNATEAQNASLDAHGGGAGVKGGELTFSERGQSGGAGAGGRFATYMDAVNFYQTEAGGKLSLGKAHAKAATAHVALHETWLESQRGKPKNGSDTYRRADTNLSRGTAGSK